MDYCRFGDESRLFDSKQRHWEDVLEEGCIDHVKELLQNVEFEEVIRSGKMLTHAAIKGLSASVSLMLQDGRITKDAKQDAVLCAAMFGRGDVMEILLNEDEVEVNSKVVGLCDERVVPILLENAVNVAKSGDVWHWFEMYHHELLEHFLMLCQERAEKIGAAVWCMKEIGMGWADMMQPTEERMGKLPVFGKA